MYVVEINNKHLCLFNSERQFNDSLYMEKMLHRDCMVTKIFPETEIIDLRNDKHETRRCTDGR